MRTLVLLCAATALALAVLPLRAEPLSSDAARNLPAGASVPHLLGLGNNCEMGALADAQPGDKDIGQALNRAILSANGHGVVRLQPGTYTNPGDILVKRAGRVSNGASGSLVLDMRGVIFTGTGKLIIDSSKGVTIRGLDAKGYTLALRGGWLSHIEDSNFDVIAFGDGFAGTDYSTNYWNRFDNVGASLVRVQAESNANTIRSPILRGDGKQGWATARPYAFEFDGNVNVQSMHVVGGDISYFTKGIYNVGPENVSGDINLTFEGGTYFDTVSPQAWAGRANVRVDTRNVFLAQPKSISGSTFAAASRGDSEAWSNTVTMGWRSFADTNFVPNGDFALSLPNYVGAGRPIVNAGGAIVIEKLGGINGRHLNIKQKSSSTTYINTDPLPFTAQYTSSIVARAGAGAGRAKIQFGFNGQYVVRDLGLEWEIVTFSTNAPITDGSKYTITLKNDGGFDIDLMYVGVTLGDRAPLIARSKSPLAQERITIASAIKLPAGPAYGPTLTVAGFTDLTRADFLNVSYDQALQGCQLIAEVVSATSVSVQPYCPAGSSAKTLAAGNVRVRVTKAAP